ncbi:helix-turn-helix domain-containing protein [Bordetella petrii]|nr:helix-turn-helix domain-containing protein [Bordetella petrii]
MTAFSESFRSEVARIARKENKGDVASLRKLTTSQRGEIAALKRDVKALTGQVRGLAKALEKAMAVIGRRSSGDHATDAHSEPGAQGDQAPSKRGGRPFVFSHEALLAKRQAFQMSQKEMAQLLGVSALSVYKWETGKATPRAAQILRVRDVLKMGVREARKKIAE